jgi:hypothetical protein
MGGNKRWSQEEIDILYKHYQGTDIERVIELLKNKRTKASIHKKASDLGISFSFSERSEIMAMLKAINERLFAIEKFLHNRRSKYDRWHDNDIVFLKNNWEHKSDYEISQILGDRFNNADVQRKRLELGLLKKKGTSVLTKNKKVISYFIKHWKSKSTREIADDLHLSLKVATSYYRKLKKEGKLPPKNKRTNSKKI